jgi:peptide/nickel transport system ATP-binding protein
MSDSAPVACDPLLTVDGLRVSFSTHGLFGQRTRTAAAVSDVSFSVGRGETLGVVGESGSGKSTTARAVMRLIDADAGSVVLDGIDLTALHGDALRQQRSALQMVFQDPYSSLDPSMTISEAVEEPLEVHRQMSRSERREAAVELLDRVGLGVGFADRYPDELSGGQRQRVAIARAIALHPKLVVCDESVSALDVSTQNQIINLLDDIQESLGTSYLFIAHDLSVVRHIAHRVAVMYLGRIVEVGPTERVFSAPAHPYTEALLSAIPLALPSAQRRRGRIMLAGDPPDPSRQPSGCAFHPRCQHAMDRCTTEAPVLQPVAGGGEASCHLLDLSVLPRLLGASDPAIDGHSDAARLDLAPESSA